MAPVQHKLLAAANTGTFIELRDMGRSTWRASWQIIGGLVEIIDMAGAE